MQVNTAYSLLRTLCLFYCENPGVLDTTSALVQLPPVGDAQSPYQVPPPPPVWPVPQLPLRKVSLTGNLRGEQEDYAQNVYVIPRSELTLPCISRHINAIVGSVSQIWTLAVKSFTSSVERQWAPVITAVTTPKIGSMAVTMPKIGIAARTTAKTRIGIGTRELAETLHQIVAATPSRNKVEDHRKRAGDSRDKKDGQDTRDRRRDSSPHPARDRSSNCECTHDYSNVCGFLDVAPVANEADRADDRLLSSSIPHPSRNPRIPSLHVDVLPDTGAWSAD